MVKVFMNACSCFLCIHYWHSTHRRQPTLARTDHRPAGVDGTGKLVNQRLYSAIAIPPGTRIGAYEVLAKLGEGGMGEVYRAKDSKLKREVAIKVLPAEVATDRERLARFQREAEVLTSLNHPHIAHIHGLEESDGTVALVMERGARRPRTNKASFTAT